MLNIIHAKFSLLSNAVASDLNDFRPLSEVQGGRERFSTVEYRGADEYLYPGLAEKKLFSCTIFANISIWEYGLIHQNVHLGCWLEESLVDVIVAGGAG
ncbi:hypothetical protein [Escherichia sp. F1]|uniref:hypothetical protein n=1 Tax=Escherichia sp. F1 TaxID=1849427 RepID=UPI00398CD447|nr:hypothetical protein [Escherichia coli]